MIQFRNATLDDLELLRYWDEKPHVIAADPDDDWEWEKELPRDPEWREQLIAELEGDPIGIVQIIDPHEEETHYWGAIGPHKRAIDIWIGEEHHLGKGYGTTMMHLALDRCFADPQVTEVLIDPLATNKDAIRFYRRLGFEFVETRRFDAVLCEVYRFPRSAWAELKAP